MSEFQKKVRAVGKALAASRATPDDIDLASLCEVEANALVDWAKNNPDPSTINHIVALTYCGRAYERIEEAKRRKNRK